MTTNYTEEENQCLLDDLQNSHFTIRKENFVDLHDLWPGLFHGRERTQQALFVQMVRLAQRNKIPFTVASAPKRNRKRYGKVTAPVLIPTAPTKRAPTKPRFQEQVLAILRNELGYAEKRITRRIAALVSEITTENVRIVLENKELRSYKKDSEVTRNDSNSPLMERHYMKAGD